MTSTRTTTRQPAAARRRAREREILRATRELFDETGVRDAQIEDIARAVGVNRAIIYRHFSGKEELFALTLVSYLDDLETRLAEAARSKRTPDVAAGRRGRGVRRLRPRVPRLRRLRPDPDAPPRPRAARGDQRELAVPPRPRHLRLPDAGSATSSTPATPSGDFHVERPTLLANHMYASGLGALQLARVGMLVKESAPGIPAIAPVSPDAGAQLRRRDRQGARHRLTRRAGRPYESLRARRRTIRDRPSDGRLG